MKEIQWMVGRLTLLTRFLPKLIERIKPILKVMKKQTVDKWNNQCEATFQEVKTMIATPYHVSTDSRYATPIIPVSLE